MTSRIVDAEKGIVKVTPKRKKVAILGAGASRCLAKHDDKDWELWGLNEINQPRAERWFEMHELFASSPKEIEWLKKCKKPIYMIKKYKSIPMSVRYPLKRIVFELDCRGYFTCTFAYQIALAIYEGFETIGLYGVNLPTGSPRERIIETACVNYWIGFAEGKGIKVHIPAEDFLLYYPYLYGYNYAEEISYAQRMVAAVWGRMCNDTYLKLHNISYKNLNNMDNYEE